MNQSGLVEQNLTLIETEIRPSLRPLEEESKAVEIMDQASYDHACSIARRAVEARRTITERLAPGKQAAHTAWKEWVSLERQLLDMVGGAEIIAKRKIATFDHEQERIRQAEQRRLEEEARKLAEEDQLAEAVAAETAGALKEEVDAILDEEPMPLYVPPAPTFERAQGVSTRENWRAEVTNLPALIKYIADHRELTYLLQPAMPALNAIARAQKNMMQIPGVRAVRENNVAIRR